MRFSTLVLPLLLLTTTTTPACVAQTPAATAPSGPPFVLEAGEMPLPSLVDKAANYLGWNILMSAQEMTSGPQGSSTVKLQQRISVDRDGCLDTLTTLLAVNGFALTVLDGKQNLYEVISMMGPRNRELTNRAQTKTAAEIAARPSLRMPVSTVVTLEHVNAVIAVNSLRPFFASSGGPSSSLTLGTAGGQSSLIVTGMQDQVANALRLIAECDKPPSPNTPDLNGQPMAEPMVKRLTERIDALEKRILALEKK